MRNRFFLALGLTVTYIIFAAFMFPEDIIAAYTMLLVSNLFVIKILEIGP